MRDGYNIAQRGFPVVTLITEDFWEQGAFVANSLGMPGNPRIKLPHPVAGLGEENISLIAEGIVEDILDSFLNV